MKVKMDFVTNSSSTSYALWGVMLDLNDFATILGVKQVEEGWTADVDSEEVYELLDSLRGLSYQTFDMEWLVGLGPESMDDFETLGEFKQRVVTALWTELKIEKKVSDVGFESGEMYDG